MLEFIMLTPIAGSAGFFVFARANIFYYISLILSPPFPLSTLLFPSFCRFLPLSLSPTGLPFLIQFIFGFIRIYAHGIHFRLRFLTFTRGQKTHFICRSLAFFSPYFWRVLMKIDAAKVRKGYWRV